MTAKSRKRDNEDEDIQLKTKPFASGNVVSSYLGRSQITGSHKLSIRVLKQVDVRSMSRTG